MNAAELHKYIKSPQALSEESPEKIKKLVDEFPYFQVAHVLLSMASKKWNAALYQQTIKRTAISVSDREKLYDLLNKTAVEIPVVVEEVKQSKQTVEVVEPIIQKEEKKEEKKEVEKTEVLQIPKVEEVTPEKVEKEIERAIVTSFVEKEMLQLKQEKKKEPESFTGWLDYLNRNKGTAVRFEEEKKEAAVSQSENIKKTKLKQKALIDKIIESNPGAIRHKEEQKFFKSDVKAKESLLENEELVTETLANIYALQGNISKAIRSYEILSLKYPQKSAYFASLIEKLRNSQKD